MPKPDDKQTVYEGRHLSMIQRGKWEYATRNTPKSVVGIVAITEDNRVVFVEQYRPPAGCQVIELPAGLVGDLQDQSDESALESAQRELLEETGYTARHWTHLGASYSTPGLTDESIELYLAEGLEKQHEGGGIEGESITLHEIPLEEIVPWLTQRGMRTDLKLLAGLYLADEHRQSKGS